MRTIQRDIVGAVILSSDKKVVLGMHSQKQGGVYADYWVVPGGGIEENEDELTALKREMQEEVNIDIAGCDITKLRVGSGVSEKVLADSGEKVQVEMKFHDYLVKHSKSSGELGDEPTEEFPHIKWFSPIEIDEELTAKPTVDLLRIAEII